jgi:hypothetical protein
MKNITIRASDELGRAYKAWLAQNKTTQQEHLEGVLEEVTGVKNKLSFKKKVKLQRKAKLREILFEEKYACIYIFRDGSWKVSYSGEHYVDAAFELRKPFDTYSREDVEAEIAKIERRLNPSFRQVSFKTFEKEEGKKAADYVEKCKDSPSLFEDWLPLTGKDGRTYYAYLSREGNEEDRKVIFEKYFGKIEDIVPSTIPDEIIEVTF